jgi:two-component system nitrate/nitrite response regulator NarL
MSNVPRLRVARRVEEGETQMRATRVVIAAQYPLVLLGLTRILEAQRDFKIVAHCGDDVSCIKAIKDLVPDIAILDASMLDNAVVAIACSKNPPTRIVLFTTPAEERGMRVLVDVGAHAVLPKDIDPEILVQSLRQVVDGKSVIQLPASDQPLVRKQSASAEKALIALTVRERDIMRLVCQGLSNKEIGRRLQITDGTIKVHLHHIFQKLEIGNRTALAALVISQSENTNKELLSLRQNHDESPSCRRASSRRPNARCRRS